MRSASATKTSAAPTRNDVAEHIAVEASRLARIAKLNDFSLLAYLIDMAVLEAWREAEEGGAGPGSFDGPEEAKG
jgi:hypothetical protein